jgi:acyl carrier protein
LEVHAIVLAKAAAIPVTSSGKTRRSACRDRYLNGQLEVIAQWKANHEAAEDSSAETPVAPRPESITVGLVENWLIERVAARLRLSPSQVHVSTSFLEFGLGSVDAVEIAAELERWLGRRMSPTVIYNHPTIAALARWLVNPPPVSRMPVPSPHRRSPAAELNRDRLLHDVRQMTEDEMRAYIVEEMAKQ